MIDKIGGKCRRRIYQNNEDDFHYTFFISAKLSNSMDAHNT